MFVFYILYASLVPLNVLGSWGVETPLNGQGVVSPPPETLRGWRDGPRHPPETASGQIMIYIDFTGLLLTMFTVVALLVPPPPPS